MESNKKKRMKLNVTLKENRGVFFVLFCLAGKFSDKSYCVISVCFHHMTIVYITHSRSMRTSRDSLWPLVAAVNFVWLHHKQLEHVLQTTTTMTAQSELKIGYSIYVDNGESGFIVFVFIWNWILNHDINRRSLNITVEAIEQWFALKNIHFSFGRFTSMFL